MLAAGLTPPGGALAQNAAGPPPDPDSSSGTTQLFSFDPHPSLTISCGSKGSVVISTKDGSVTLNDCPVDDGARAFWEAVARLYGTNAGNH
jgi:hypothetical protein